MGISNSHALLLVQPGMGHIIPALEFAKRLVTHKIISKLTFFYGSIKTSTPSKAETKVLESAIKENLFDLIQLPPIDLTTLVGPHATIQTKIATLMHEIPPLFVSTFSTMNLNPTIIITDFFLSQVLPLVEKLIKVPMFVFSPTNAWHLALALHTPTLDKQIQGEYVNEIKPISIPGCKPLHHHDLFDVYWDRTHRLYHEFVAVCEGAALADGIFVNTFHELEPKTLEALGSGYITKVPVYPVGPIIRDQRSPNGSNEGKKSEVFEWLEKQEEECVVYVSLGSGYSMSCDQIKEMALGLELSGIKFVWHLLPPVTKAGNDHYFTAGEEIETGTIHVSNTAKANPFPREFHRIQVNGIVITDWAPQSDILKHPSIGGFVSHCGWNSVMESISCGVPMIGLPLFAEQMMNATMLMEEVGNAIRVDVSPSTNMFRRDELSKAIRKIMDKDDKEGRAMRERAKKHKHLAEKAWFRDASSYLPLSKITRSNIWGC